MPYRLRNGRWQIRVSTGQGKRIEVTLPPGAKERDAHLKEAQILRAQVDLSAGIKPRILIDDALTDWEESEAVLLKSYQKDLRYRIDILRSAFTGGKYLDEIEKVAERVKKVGNAGGLKPATINRLLAILRRIGRINRAQATISLLPGERSRQVYLTAEEVNLLCEKADPRLADFIHFACLSGMRRGEILRLEPHHLKDGAALIEVSKSGRPRRVPLPPEALEIAERCLPFNLTATNINRMFRHARTVAGLPHVRLHDLRHTYASWLVQSGASLTAVRDLLGHSNLAVTSKYSHLAPGHLRKAVEGLPVLDGSGMGPKKQEAA